MITNCKKLRHVSFDYNNFTTDHFEYLNAISEALKTNHTIYGFHFAGHPGYVDHLGFYRVYNWRPNK